MAGEYTRRPGASGRHYLLPMPQDIRDITIIGGGPTGLFAAFYAGILTHEPGVSSLTPYANYSI